MQSFGNDRWQSGSSSLPELPQSSTSLKEARHLLAASVIASFWQVLEAWHKANPNSYYIRKNDSFSRQSEAQLLQECQQDPSFAHAAHRVLRAHYYTADYVFTDWMQAEFNKPQSDLFKLTCLARESYNNIISEHGQKLIVSGIGTHVDTYAKAVIALHAAIMKNKAGKTVEDLSREFTGALTRLHSPLQQLAQYGIEEFSSFNAISTLFVAGSLEVSYFRSHVFEYTDSQLKLSTRSKMELARLKESFDRKRVLGMYPAALGCPALKANGTHVILNYSRLISTNAAILAQLFDQQRFQESTDSASF